MTPKTQKRIARVKAALETIQQNSTKAAAAKASARTQAKSAKAPVTIGGRPRVALQGGEPAKIDNKALTKKVAPIVNNLDTKTTALDKMISGLLSAIDSGNDRNIRTLMDSVVKKLRELGAEGDRLEPLTASAKTRKANVAKTMARGRLAVAKARRALA